MALDTNLVSYYNLNGHASDAVGTNNGTATNITYSTGNGKIDQGASFNGSSSDIDLGNIDITGNITVSTWIKPTNLPGSGDADVILSKEGATLNGSQYVLRLQENSGTPRIQWFTYNDTLGFHGINYNITLSTGTWYHLAGVFDGTTWILYVNGTSVATSTDSQAPISNAYNARIGKRYDGIHRLDSCIDEFGIWSRALTSTEITALYNGGAGINPVPLTTRLNNYWKLDESSGNAADSVGGSTLTNTNTVTYGAAKINNGAIFASASSQYFTTADTAALSITGDASWSFWMKPDTGNTDPVVLAKNKDVNQRSYYIQPNFSSNYINLVNYDTGADANSGNATVTVPAMSAGTWYHIVVVFTASTHTIEVYTQGTSRGTAAGTLKTSIFDGTSAFEIGRYSAGASNYFNGMLDEVGIWSRVLTPLEVTSLYAGGSGKQYPFPSSNIWTLILAQQSYALTGEASLLRHGAKLLQAFGAFTLTGVNTLLGYGRKLTNAFGAFVLTGGDVLYMFGKAISAAFGSFTLTGEDMSFKKALSFVASQASFVLTGVSANLTAAIKFVYSLSMSFGQFALSGMSIFSRVSGWLFETKKAPSMNMETKKTNTWEIDNKN